MAALVPGIHHFFSRTTPLKRSKQLAAMPSASTTAKYQGGQLYTHRRNLDADKQPSGCSFLATMAPRWPSYSRSRWRIDLARKP